MTKEQHLTFWRLLLAAATTFAIIMALLPTPPQLNGVGDKWQHMTAFATLTLLSLLAYPKAPLLRIAERLSFLGALIEVAQSIPVLHRDCDIMDWIADTAAILVVIALAGLFRHLRGDAAP